jgi:hypothetical protein
VLQLAGWSARLGAPQLRMHELAAICKVYITKRILLGIGYILDFCVHLFFFFFASFLP